MLAKHGFSFNLASYFISGTSSLLKLVTQTYSKFKVWPNLKT